MDAKTLKALKGSIKKWERIVAGKGEDHGVDNCPLCQLFNTPSSIPRCVGCPVRGKTGRTGCEGTPYDQWEWMDDTPPYSETQLEVAAQELAFLRSLLPAKHSPPVRGGEK